MITILDSSAIIWANDMPNSPYCVRPVVLLAPKENNDNVKFLITWLTQKSLLSEPEDFEFFKVYQSQSTSSYV